MATIIEFGDMFYYDVKQLISITIPQTRSITSYVTKCGIPDEEDVYLRPVNKQNKPCKNSMEEFHHWDTPNEYVQSHDVSLLSCDYYHSKQHQKRLGKTKVVLVHPRDRKEGSIGIKGTGIVSVYEKEDNDDMALLDLNDEDLFIDKNGIKWTVETRGKRESGKCFFCVADLSKYLEETRLRSIITDKKSGYKLGEHYVHYKGADKTTRLFVNHTGLNKIVANSKSPAAKSFSKWINDIFYTVHAGTNTQKIVLGQRLITKGIQIEDCPDYFDLSSTRISVIYNFDLGSVEQLDDEFGEYVPEQDPSKPDRRRLIKFGRTVDIKQRCEQHIINYPREKGYSPVLIKYWIIEEKLLPQAEKEFSRALSKMGLKVDVEGASERNGKTEIAIYTREELASIYKTMDVIQEKYGKGMESIIELLRLKEAELALSAANNVISIKDHELKMNRKMYEMSQAHNKELTEIKDKSYQETSTLKDKLHKEEIKNKDLQIERKDNELIIYKLREENKTLQKRLAKK